MTEEAIYSTAARLFAEKGYASTTLENIASQVGVHKSTIFHYVTIKDELLATILDRGLRDYVESLEKIAHESECDGATRFQAAVRNHLRFVFERGRELKIFLRERQHLNSRQGRAYLQMKERYEALFISIVEDGIADGSMVERDPALLCLFVLGAANSIVEWFSPEGRMSADEVTEQFIETIVAPTTLPTRRRSPAAARRK
ncbi:MAG: TetR/AcrR family transcriptional regulator [Actinomycetota bacterium]|nr:TetR/AcrR family transcriptional regulator [Actinomycetota bacterium]